MSLQKRGKNISHNVLVLNISACGIWILVQGEEFFMPYTLYPWFQEATIKQILNVEFSSAAQLSLFWPNLDIDIALECLRYPERFPLVSKKSNFQK